MRFPFAICFACCLSAVYKVRAARVATRSLLDQDIESADWDFDAADNESSLDQETGSTDPVSKQVDISKPNFKMPDFNDLARIRPYMLENHGFARKLAPPIAKEAVDTWGTRNGAGHKRNAEKGIEKKRWIELKLGPKLAAFNNYAHPVGQRETLDGKMNFFEFADLLKEQDIDPDWDADPTKGDPDFKFEETHLKDKEQIITWLSKHYGYRARGYWRDAESVAKLFLKKKKRTMEDITTLARFAKLDTNRDGILQVDEAQPILPVVLKGELKDKAYEWGTTARVLESDLDSLNFPKVLTTDVLQMSEFGTISRQEWNNMHLKDKLTDFIKILRKRDDPKGRMQAKLRFHQAAPLFPSFPSCKVSEDCYKKAYFEQLIKEKKEKIEIPSIDDIVLANKTEEVNTSTHYKSGRLEIGEEDLNKWLTHKAKMTKKNARDMAVDILKYGNGTLSREQGTGEKSNGHIQGHRADSVANGGSGDEWSEVAPRMALFVRLDTDGDGYLDFSAVHPYLSPQNDAFFENDLFMDKVAYGKDAPELSTAMERALEALKTRTKYELPAVVAVDPRPVKEHGD